MQVKYSKKLVCILTTVSDKSDTYIHPDICAFFNIKDFIFCHKSQFYIHTCLKWDQFLACFHLILFAEKI